MIPRTAILGAILLTGCLGGAVATHVRVGSPLFGADFTCATNDCAPLFLCGVSLSWGAAPIRRMKNHNDVLNELPVSS